MLAFITANLELTMSVECQNAVKVVKYSSVESTYHIVVPRVGSFNNEFISVAQNE